MIVEPRNQSQNHTHDFTTDSNGNHQHQWGTDYNLGAGGGSNNPDANGGQSYYLNQWNNVRCKC